jgi:hypothetical protein
MLAAVVLVFVVRDGCINTQIPFLSGPRDSDLLAWAPADTDGVAGVDMGDLFSHQEVREIFVADDYRAFRDAGFDLGSVERLLVAGRVTKAARFEAILIVRLKRPFDPNGPVKAGRAKVRHRGDKPYLVFDNGTWLFNATERTVLLTDYEPLLLDAMSYNGDDIRIGKDLVKAIEAATGPVWCAGVGPAVQPDTRAFYPDLLRLGKTTEPHPLRLSETLSTRVTGDRTEFTDVSMYSSPEKAKIAADQLDAGLKRLVAEGVAGRPPSDPELHFVRVMHDSLRIEPAADKVTITFNLPHRELRRLKAILR